MSEHDFPRAVRLLSASDFSRVFKKPRKSIDNCFTVLGRSNQLDQARLGLAISKKHVKLAVDRNRTKRVIRESFRHHRQLMTGLDLIVLARAGTAGLTNKQLFSSLESHWKRLVKTKSTLN